MTWEKQALFSLFLQHHHTVGLRTFASFQFPPPPTDLPLNQTEQKGNENKGPAPRCQYYLCTAQLAKGTHQGPAPEILC